ncbi:uncharacterized protein N7484_000579 [Penicillium longicatenatum]|uniref:uncharacterized protein n=1 Tax=Penicillium longicatenatum TaxID=1561947 RepID=UPI0025492213|nr:uncharacterized protein N7484_000579 [Penicillium longicatenatum]KAJ5661207.1 hypothetical protein N7484_000579 [Penicillium longicatenatum]
MEGVNPVTKKAYTVTLTDCLYTPSFHYNLVSLGRLEQKGAWWDMRKGHIMHNGESRPYNMRMPYEDPYNHRCQLQRQRHGIDVSDTSIKEQSSSYRSSSIELRSKIGKSNWSDQIASYARYIAW